MKKNKFYLHQEGTFLEDSSINNTSLEICEQKVEELKKLRFKYGFLKNYYVIVFEKNKRIV